MKATDILVCVIIIWMVQNEVIYYGMKKDIKNLKNHIETCGKILKIHEYQLDVITESIKGVK